MRVQFPRGGVPRATPNCISQDATGVVEKQELAATAGTASASAAAAAVPPGYELDAASGYYYSADSRMYYDASSGAFFSADTGQWFSYDAATQQFVPHANVSAA